MLELFVVILVIVLGAMAALYEMTFGMRWLYFIGYAFGALAASAALATFIQFVFFP